jgi:pimeloyl-ACP methyl ester carboxylesterase
MTTNRLLALISFLLSSAFLVSSAHAVATITVGSLTLTHCNDEYDGYCGTITVPLDRQGNLPGDLTVGFEFYPHTDNTQPSAGVIMAQEGGPGYSTTGSRDGYVRLFTPLRDHRDILLIDKRGTGRSSAIDCRKLQKAYSPSQSDIAACANQLGESAWFYRSADAADDVAAVMAALQFAQADYYGDSYGTWFGQVLAVLHPELLRTIVLDSAYPVANDHSNSEVNHGQEAMNLVCERSAPCKALESSATARFAALLSALRAQPVSGTAPGANGESLNVTADPAGLFLIIGNAGNTPTTWRDLDAAGRAWMDQQDSLPLLRLVAEARDSYSGGGSYKGFSVGLADAVQCAEYGTNFNLNKGLNERQSQYEAFLNRLRTNHPDSFPPFEIDDAINSQMDVEGYDTCLTWPAPPSSVVAGQPIPQGSLFPQTPVLVLSGQLDTITSPSEGKATAALFPNSTYIRTKNMVHESAISDGGVFVSPNGQDLSQCIGPIVRNFIQSGGNTGDTSCVKEIRPIRTVPAFAVSYTTTAPAIASPGNMTSTNGLVIASAVTETVGDVIARYYITTSGIDSGLRGGTFTLSSSSTGYTFVLDNLKWANDLAVSGNLGWNQLTGAISGEVTFVASGHTGNVSIAWNDQQTEAIATLTGVIDGDTLAATRIAP